MINYKNKTFLISINFIDEKDNLIEQYQTSGIVINVTKNYIKLKRNNESDYFIPNDNNLIKKTDKGIYRERTTGKETENPDFISQWAVHIKDSNNIDSYKEIGFEPIN